MDIGGGVLERAPDDKAREAARALAVPGASWVALGAVDCASGVAFWGEFQGSSSQPYRALVWAPDGGQALFECSCPSRKQPCKHALALGLVAQDEARRLRDQPPDWALERLDWLDPGTSDSEETARLEPPDSWRAPLQEQIEAGHLAAGLWDELSAWLARERAAGPVFPPPGGELRALQATPFDQVRAVILGQDPYHGPGQAHGLAFSVPDGTAWPPSLRNILTEWRDDTGHSLPRSGDLSAWTREGVLLLNTILTVRAGQAFSHRGQGWEEVTDAIVRALGARAKPVTFVLWGNAAARKEALVSAHHTVLKSAHPSPLSAHRGFFGSRPFSRVNESLTRAGEPAIDWRL